MPDELSPQDGQAAAAESQADVGSEHVATVYAEAMLGAAQDAGQTESLLAELDSLVADVLDRFPALERLLGSALVSHEEKAGILDRVFGASASPLLMNSLKVVSRHGRLDCLRAIHRRLHELDNQARNRIPVVLSTATPVGEALAGRLRKSLSQLFGGEPILSRVVDPELIGGAVVRVGDTVYDGSVANQLKRARQQMIDRSVHEIQSRRDRFRYPAGN
jgi:F-type H+-transporting ATPase subunit delta